MEHYQTIARGNAYLMRRDAKLHKRYAVHTKREYYTDGQPTDANGHQSRIHAKMHKLCRHPIPNGRRSRQRGPLPAHDPQPQRQKCQKNAGKNKLKSQKNSDLPIGLNHQLV